MRTSASTPRRHRRLLVFALPLVLLALAVACAPAPPAEGPAGAVAQALDRLAEKDLDGLRGLACAGQEDVIRDQLGLAAAGGSQVIPGLEADELLDAVAFDVSELELGEPAVEGDVAQVPVTGSVRVTFDPEAMRPILRRVLEAQGREVTDEQLEALLGSLGAFGQEVPVDESLRLVREGGAWKLCQEAPVR